MFNIMKLKSSFLLIILVFLSSVSCKKETNISFSEINIFSEKETLVEVVMPKANGDSNIASTINITLTKFACDILNIDSAKEKKLTIEESIIAFNDAYKDFNALILKEFEGDFPNWEAFVDGEISYKNESIVSIAMTGSVITNAANNNLVFKFFNFDLATGKSLKTKDLINDIDQFTALVKKYYDKELMTVHTSLQAKNLDFKLPETIGFNDDGVIIIYNDFEFGALSKDAVEFTIPYTVANPFLKY